MSIFSFLSISNNSAAKADLHDPLGTRICESNVTRFSSAFLLSTFVFLVVFLNYGRGKVLSVFKGNRLNEIPTPSGILLYASVLYHVVTTRDIIRVIRTLGRKYSSIYNKYYRLPGLFPYIILTSPESAESLLSSNEDGHLTKPDEYVAMADYLDHGMITSCGDKWKMRRKLFSPLFNYGCFPHFLEVFNRHTKQLMVQLDEIFKDSSAQPIQTPIYESALKMICETAMGVELHSTSKEFTTFFEEADKTKEYIFQRGARPWLRVEWIWRLHPFRSEYERNVKFIKDYILKVIVDARQKFGKESAQNDSTGLKGKNKTVMDVMLENGMSDLDIREEAHTMISAGHETSAATLQFALILLALHPEHQSQCQAEIDEIINDESKCPNGDFTLTSLADLKHTERCLKETLRLYPTVHLYGRKIQTPLRLDEGTTLPKNTTCAICVTDIHLNPKIYPEPEKFDPSRFTPETSAARHPYAYLPFARGPRMCLGYKYAMAQMTLILARILHHFSVFTTDKIEDVPFFPSILITPIRGYNFVLKNRNPLPPCNN